MLVNKLVAEGIIKITNLIFSFANWLEFEADPSRPLRNIGGFLISIGKKINPKSFCPHCGVPVEKCYYGISAKGIVNKPPYKYHCCNCEYPLE
jgi:hypothetical protein